MPEAASISRIRAHVRQPEVAGLISVNARDQSALYTKWKSMLSFLFYLFITMIPSAYQLGTHRA